MNIIRMLLILIAFVLLNIYLFVRGWQSIPGQGASHFIYAVLFIFCATSVFVAVFVGNRLPLWLSRIFDITGGYWIILFVFILLAAFTGDLLRLANHFFGIFPDWVKSNYTQVKLLYLLATLLIIMIISGIGFYRFSHPKVTNLEIATGNKIKSSSDFKMIIASDIHLGQLIRKGRLQKWVALINQQHPDIVIFGGDVFDHNLLAVIAQGMDKELSKINARCGVYAVPGNHDYYAGIDEALKYLKSSGIHILRDSVVTIDNRIVLIGRDDLTNKGRKPLATLIKGISGDLPSVLIDHQPVSIAESVDNKIDVHFSGHTHNGQIFPFSYFVSKIYPLGYGYKKIGNTHCYVSSGLGLWGAAIRLGTNSEIVLIKLK
jgi:uncharacterized protein